MAKALVEVVGDSASAVRALEETSAAFTATGDAADKAAVGVDAFAASMAKAQATRAETLLAQAGSLRTYAAGSDATALEASAARTKAAQNETRAQKLLGIQTAQTASVTETAGKIGRGLTTYVTVPTALIGYEAVKQALDYNQALLLIRTQAGASQAELNNMNSAVLQLVQSGHSYGQTANQMAQGLYYVESEGIRGARALTILQTAAAGAANGQTDMADTTNALTSAMKVYNVATSETAKTMATIDAITAVGKMHLQDLNEAFGTKFFDTARSLGIPLEQAGAALDVFTKAGVPASVAANNMTTSFIKMETPAKAAIPYLASLGLTANSLGLALQNGGLSSALEKLATGYEHLLQTQGKHAASQAVLESFGGSRSGAPALLLVQQYASYMKSLGEIQRLNDPANFWTRVSESMDQPAMKIKQSVAEIGADFIKLGTALAPTVASIASGVATITSGFQALPGPIKEAAGVIVGALAVAGPIGMAVKGVGELVKGLKAAFRGLGLSAEEGAAAADPALAGLGTSVGGDITKVKTLQGELAGLASKVFITTLILDIIPKSSAGQRALDQAHLGFLGHIPILGGAETQIARAGYATNQALAGLTGDSDAQIAARRRAAAQRRYAATHPNFPDFALWKLGNPHGTRAEYDSEKNLAFDMQHPNSRRARRDAHDHHHTPQTTFHQPPSSTFVLPQNLANQLAKAQAGYGNINQVDARIRKYILGLLHSGQLTGKGIEEAYNELATVQNKATADAHKAQTKFDQVVHNDTLLQRARLDLAQGEYSAAQELLRQDQARLQMMLAEAKTTEERTVVLRQLAEVERLRHTKADAFQLSPALQARIAQIDAEAVLNPTGMLAQQVAAAKQAKAQALRAIHSHTLTMQGLTQAWSIVEQENQVILSALGMAHTYHAVSSRAIVDSVKGLTAAQQMQLRERISQSEAHRGYVPNSPQAHHHYHHVTVHVQSNDSHIVKVVDKHHRQKHQRAGSRR